MHKIDFYVGMALIQQESTETSQKQPVRDSQPNPELPGYFAGREDPVVTVAAAPTLALPLSLPRNALPPHLKSLHASHQCIHHLPGCIATSRTRAEQWLTMGATGALWHLCNKSTGGMLVVPSLRPTGLGLSLITH